MVVGLIGVGIVGGTLKGWFEKHTKHDIRCLDPNKNLNDSLEDCEAIFISVPVEAMGNGQDLRILESCINLAKQHTQFVFVRSSVLPGTSDHFGCIAMPEFLTERTAAEDMERLPILVGKCDQRLLDCLFPGKEKIILENTEAELAKYAHNCFGAIKVTYFNVINEICERLGADFDSVKKGMHLTGFVEKQHTMVPGPDGYYGYGGKCFPTNMDAMTRFLGSHYLGGVELFKTVIELNNRFRDRDQDFPAAFV